VVQGLVTVPWDILVCVGWFTVDIELHAAVGMTVDDKVKHGDLATVFFFSGPFDGGGLGIEVVEKEVNMVAVDSCEGVVHLAEPK
jgi:hypothetical protein